MNTLYRIMATALACLAVALAHAQAPAAPQDEGVVLVKTRKVDKAWLLPGADFRPYRKVLLKDAEVAFQKGWVRDMNSNRSSMTTRITDADAMKIVEVMRGGFNEIWAETFKSAGFEVVKAPGEDVLQVRPSVVNLYMNAPQAASAGTTRSYTVEAGEATLHLEIRDSRTGTLLARVADRRETMRSPRPQMTDAVTNRAQFGTLFVNWATIAVKGLQELQAVSPLPETLKPGQKIEPR
jgi:hypothetical protein